MSESPSDTSAVIDPHFLRRVRALFFKLRRRHRLRNKGVQPTPALGFTREFKDYRHYSPSDDFRSIDWRLYARAERLFVKLYEEIQEFHVHILIDRSASMVDPFPRKRAASIRLAAALAYLGLMNQHRVSLYSFADQVRVEIPGVKGQGHIHRIGERLQALPFTGATDLLCLERFRPRRDRRGIVFLLSDLLGGERVESTPLLQTVSSWPAETHIVHIMDPGEMHPALGGDVQLSDVETGETASFAFTEDDMVHYAEAYERFVQQIASASAARRIDYVAWRTDVVFERHFLDLLTRGRVLRQP